MESQQTAIGWEEDIRNFFYQGKKKPEIVYIKKKKFVSA